MQARSAAVERQLGVLEGVTLLPTGVVFFGLRVLESL